MNFALGPCSFIVAFFLILFIFIVVRYYTIWILVPYIRVAWLK